MKIFQFLQKFLPEPIRYYLLMRSQRKAMLNHSTHEEWVKKGSPIPPPAHLKKELMKDYAKRYNATHFVETGTFMGDTTNEMKDFFEKVDSIELDVKLSERAKNRFMKNPNVRIWQGDSGEVINQVLHLMPKSTIGFFYLDGHFSGGITAKADINTPIAKEIDAIYHHSAQHVIFIDDARLFFNDEQDYPQYESLTKQVKNYNSLAQIKVELDMIIITNS